MFLLYFLARAGGSSRRWSRFVVVVACNSGDDQHGSDDCSDRGCAQSPYGPSTRASCSTRTTRTGLCLGDLSCLGWFCRGSRLLLRKRDRGRKHHSNKSSNKAFH